MAKTVKTKGGVEVINEIRMVYNVTKSGLYDAVSAPWFSLPTIELELRAARIGTFICDCDVVEIFLNFMLELKLRRHEWVDLLQRYPEEAVEKGKYVKAEWEKILIGFAPSPYFVTKDMLKVKKMTKGSHLDSSNMFRWLSVTLNLPEIECYNSILL